ncbi:MAG: DUF5752 family protein [Conexivisphaerales archaeon]
MIEGLPEQKLDPLRIVPWEKSFFFYRDVGQPLGKVASSYEEFAAQIKSIDASSLEFHLLRDDFANWFTMLGDRPIIRRLSYLKKKNLKGEELRRNLITIVESRLSTLKQK